LEKKKESTSVWKTLGLMTNIGVTLAAAVLIGYYMGYYLDQWIFGKTNRQQIRAILSCIFLTSK
jgi:F0F1-type ATP synthase assembly protein I